MSEDIETDPREEQLAQEEIEVTKNSVPIISDKEIEAIFVGGVPLEADESYLQQSFEKFGEIKSVKIINSVKTKKPKRFAIVTFNHHIPSSILMQDHWIMGRKVDVKEYLSGEEANNKLSREKQRKVFVGGLPLTVNNEILKGYFQQFGKVIEANIVYNHETMRSRGFGFVIFQDEKTVQEVLKRYDDHYLYGKWIECKPALLKEEVTTEPSQSMMSPQTPHMFTPNTPAGGRMPKSQMTLPGKPEMKGGAIGAKVLQDQNKISEDSEGEITESAQLSNPAGKKQNLKDPKKGSDAMKLGSEDGSQNDSQGQSPQIPEYNQYGMPQHPPYSYTSYNYQMPPHAMGGHAYGIYPNYSPIMGQRPPMKQYPGFPAYNYQERGFHPGMNMKAMPPSPEYYDDYKYGDTEMPLMRSPIDNQPVFHPMKSPEYGRTGKGQKVMMGDRPMGQYPGYQYAGQPMGPMFPPMPHPGHYDIRSPYDYAQYKSKGEMHAGQPGFYYKNMPMPPYNYDPEDARRGPAPRNEAPNAVGSKPKKSTGKAPKPTEDNKDLKPAKMGKAKQFAEDLDNKNSDE